MIMLGGLVRASNMISYDAMLKNLPEILGEGKAKLLKLNQQALDRRLQLRHRSRACHQTTVGEPRQRSREASPRSARSWGAKA